jgi:hypothetical protein
MTTTTRGRSSTMATINQAVAQRAEFLADRMLARLQTIRTPHRRALALRSALRKLGVNEQVAAQVGAGINMRRALVSAYGDFIRSYAGIGGGMGTTQDFETGLYQAGQVLDLIDTATDVAGNIGETMADVWGAFTGGSQPPPPPPPPDPAKPVQVAQVMGGKEGLERLSRFARMVRRDSTQPSGGGAGGGIIETAEGISPWILAGGAAAIAGIGYYLVTKKKK